MNDRPKMLEYSIENGLDLDRSIAYKIRILSFFNVRFNLIPCGGVPKILCKKHL